MKNYRKGFTIVELVIVIAVVTVLAAVLIPTFSSIIKKANISSDMQLVRNMNVILKAEESASPVPSGPKEAIDLLKANGIERLHPKTKFYGFYWIKSRNTVLLADEGNHPIYPEEMLGELYDRDDWFDLTEKYAATTTVTEKEDDPVAPPEETDPPVETEPPEPRTVTVTYTCNRPEFLSNYIPSDTAKTGYPYNYTFILAEGGQYWISKITVYENGVQKMTKFGSPGDNLDLTCTNVNGDLEINVHVIEYRTVTFEGEDVIKQGIVIKCEKGVGCMFERDDLEAKVSADVNKIKSVKVYMEDRGELLNVYDPENKTITISHVTGNVTITFELEKDS